MNKRFNDVKKAKTRDRSNNEVVTFLRKIYKWGYVVLISVFIQYISVIEINSVSTWKTVYTEFHILFYFTKNSKGCRKVISKINDHKQMQWDFIR